MHPDYFFYKTVKINRKYRIAKDNKKFLKIENIVCGQGWGNGYAYAVGEASLEGKSPVNNSDLK